LAHDGPLDSISGLFSLVCIATAVRHPTPQCRQSDLYSRYGSHKSRGCIYWICMHGLVELKCGTTTGPSSVKAITIKARTNVTPRWGGNCLETFALSKHWVSTLQHAIAGETHKKCDCTAIRWIGIDQEAQDRRRTALTTGHAICALASRKETAIHHQYCPQHAFYTTRLGSSCQGTGHWAKPDRLESTVRPSATFIEGIC
jgi:hypothetical protein